MSKEKETENVNQLWHSAIPENMHLALNISQSNNLHLDTSDFTKAYAYLADMHLLKQGLTDVMDMLAAFGKCPALLLMGELPKPDFSFEKVAPFFEQLTEISLSTSILKEYPTWIHHFQQIHTLRIRRTEISRIPTDLLPLPNLVYLSMENNDKLDTLPDFFDLFPKLQYLNLQDSPIQRLPDSFYTCSDLIKLDINRTPLISLSPLVEQLQELQAIDCTSTALTNLPIQLCKLPKLSYLKITDTPLLENAAAFDDSEMGIIGGHQNVVKFIKQVV